MNWVRRLTVSKLQAHWPQNAPSGCADKVFAGKNIYKRAPANHAKRNEKHLHFRILQASTIFVLFRLAAFAKNTSRHFANRRWTTTLCGSHSATSNLGKSPVACSITTTATRGSRALSTCSLSPAQAHSQAATSNEVAAFCYFFCPTH